jgi:hypothetical protein
MKFQKIICLQIIGIFLLGLAWIVSFPARSFVDDNTHLPAIWCVGSVQNEKCQANYSLNEDGNQVVTYKLSEDFESPCADRIFPPSPQCNPPNAIERERSRTEVNQWYENTSFNPISVKYTSGYFYGFMNLLTSSNFVISILLLKILNLFLFIFMLGIILFFGDKRTRRIFSIFTLAFLNPMSIYFLTSLHPASWQLISIPTTFLTTEYIIRTRYRISKDFRSLSLYSNLVFSCFLISLSRRDGFLILCAVFLGVILVTKNQNFVNKKFLWVFLFLTPILFWRIYDFVLRLSSFTKSNTQEMLIENFKDIGNYWGGFFGYDVNRELISYMANYRIDYPVIVSRISMIAYFIFWILSIYKSIGWRRFVISGLPVLVLLPAVVYKTLSGNLFNIQLPHFISLVCILTLICAVQLAETEALLRWYSRLSFPILLTSHLIILREVIRYYSHSSPGLVFQNHDGGVKGFHESVLIFAFLGVVLVSTLVWANSEKIQISKPNKIKSKATSDGKRKGRNS